MIRISKRNIIYAMSPNHAPIAHVPSGETVIFETCDCFEDQIQTEDTVFSELDWNKVNPATGPIFVEGAQPGDILKVKIQKIEIDDHGVMVTGPGLGVIGDQLTENKIRIIPIQNDQAIFSSTIQFPINKMIGVIGTAPTEGEISCGVPDYHGGNMDSVIICEGTTLYLPVNVEGALLAMGDLHAAMGDGEVAVCGIEIAGEVTVQIEVLKQKNWPLPMAITKDRVYTIASTPLLDDAANLATRNMVQVLEAECGLDKHDAIALMSATGQLQISQVVDPNKTSRFGMPKNLLEQLGFQV